MKKFTLILSRLMVLLAAVAFVACGQTNEEIDNKDPNPDEKPDPKPEPDPDPIEPTKTTRKKKKCMPVWMMVNQPHIRRF